MFVWDAEGCLGLVHGDDPERWYGVLGGVRGSGFGNSCTPSMDSCQCMATQINKIRNETDTTEIQRIIEITMKSYIPINGKLGRNG